MNKLGWIITDWWTIWKYRPVNRAYQTMANALRNDPEFAQSWQANIAMPIYDGAKGRLTHAEANEIADKLMAHLWGVSKWI